MRSGGCSRISSLLNIFLLELVPEVILVRVVLFPSIHSERSLALRTPARPHWEVPPTPCRSRFGVAEMDDRDRSAYRRNLSGFAVVLAAADYRVMGVQTLIVSYQGIIYQKDLGPDSRKIFKTWTRAHDRWPGRPRTFQVGPGKTGSPGTHSAVSAGDTFENRTRRC